jgi:hypothetical protein
MRLYLPIGVHLQRDVLLRLNVFVVGDQEMYVDLSRLLTGLLRVGIWGSD